MVAVFNFQLTDIQQLQVYRLLRIQERIDKVKKISTSNFNLPAGMINIIPKFQVDAASSELIGLHDKLERAKLECDAEAVEAFEILKTQMALLPVDFED